MEQKKTYLVHHGIKGMKWGVRKSKKSSNKLSRKEYRNIVKKNKQILRNNKGDYFTNPKRSTEDIIKSDKKAIKDINEARVKRGKKKVDSIMFNLPGALV